MNILVVGAGLSGSVISRELADAGHNINVIDKRDHIAGNTRDVIDSFGIRKHVYGPHLFHTNNENVIVFVKKFAEWIDYKHKVKAMLSDGRLVTLPVNAETKQIVGEENIIETFFRPYTEKMWGMPLERVSPDVLKRVPIRDDLNELYFPNDKFQGLPKYGYENFVSNILNHPNIEVRLNTSFHREMENDYDYCFNSMPIDEYYDYRFGRLEYRSIKFHDVLIPCPRVFNVATVNLTNTGPYTRITEWKNLPDHGENDLHTLLTYEEPCDFRENNDEKFYPVKDIDGKNRELFNKYMAISNLKTKFIGRLGLYSYLDMDQCINSALIAARNFIRDVR
jgi:UDP-galactopyranose mutase